MYKILGVLCCVSLALSLVPFVGLYVNPYLRPSYVYHPTDNANGYSIYFDENSYIDVFAPNTTLNLNGYYDNVISSLEVSPCTIAQLCVDSDLRGKCVMYINSCSSTTVLEQQNLKDDGIDDAITSWKILSIESLMSNPDSDDYIYVMSILQKDQAKKKMEHAKRRMERAKKGQSYDDLSDFLTYSKHTIIESS